MDAPADDFLEDMDDGDVGDACPIEAFHQEEIAQVKKKEIKSSLYSQYYAEACTSGIFC